LMATPSLRMGAAAAGAGAEGAHSSVVVVVVVVVVPPAVVVDVTVVVGILEWAVGRLRGRPGAAAEGGAAERCRTGMQAAARR
jgi:hypothetical protein